MKKEKDSELEITKHLKESGPTFESLSINKYAQGFKSWATSF
jgi:hypothetical protein